MKKKDAGRKERKRGKEKNVAGCGEKLKMYTCPG